MVSEQAQAEFRRESKRLREQAKTLLSQADRIDALLLEFQAESRVAVKNGSATSSHRIDPNNGASFASHIREALRVIGRTATSREVAEVLINAGYPEDRNGKPIRDIVSVDLYTMAAKRRDGVRKVARGRYRID